MNEHCKRTDGSKGETQSGNLVDDVMAQLEEEEQVVQLALVVARQSTLKLLIEIIDRCKQKYNQSKKTASYHKYQQEGEDLR